ncbi:MAG: PQQ-dependent sugar dehydrogenase [Chloroflexi bacterium]|nr:PQQ-dependent sugar dehydrogenase [Chloroflexota bacterium]
MRRRHIISICLFMVTVILASGCSTSTPRPSAEVAIALPEAMELEPPLEREEPHTTAQRWGAEPVLRDLEFPISWALAADGRLFFTEGYTGRVRSVVKGQVVEKPVIELPDAVGSWEQGMLGLAVHPDFSTEPYLYLYYTAIKETEEGQQEINRLVRFRAEDDPVQGMEVLLDDLPSAGYHNGGIVLFGPDGKLYVSIGDGHQAESAQDPTSLTGKILRLNPDGTIPEDNPFADSPVYALGFRNVFGMAFDPVSGHLFVTENGPDCCDEVNQVRPGQNYGWPLALGESPGGEFAHPLLVFTSSIAPTQALFYSGGPLPLGHDLLFGDFIHGSLHRVVLSETERDTVVFHEVLFTAQTPIIGILLDLDGNLYFSTPSELYRLTFGEAEEADIAPG